MNGADISSPTTIIGQELNVATAGAAFFAETLRAQAVPVTEVHWQPAMSGTDADLERVLGDPRRPLANSLAVRRMLDCSAYLVDVLPAGPTLGLGPCDFLHSGPPISWDRATGPLRGALIGAAMLEGQARFPADARALFSNGAGACLDSCHHHHAVGPMAGVVTSSMWMFAVEDATTGRRCYCSLNEGLGKVLRYGAYSPEVLDRLRWMAAVLGPTLQRAVRAHGPLSINAILAQMLHMGDEAHNRNRSGTLMLLRDLLPDLIECGATSSDVADVVKFIGGNDHFFLNLAMPACKLALDAARNIPGSTMVVAMARNGTDFGIQVSGTGDNWYTGPSLVPEGLYLPGYGPDDANPDIGDSAVTETYGLGGFAMAAAPAIAQLVGGSPADAIASTLRMYEITLAEHPVLTVPVLGFRGVPCGIDVTKIVRTGLLPQINTGIAGRTAGTGQVGAGRVTPPSSIFRSALAALAASAEAARPRPGPGPEDPLRSRQGSAVMARNARPAVPDLRVQPPGSRVGSRRGDDV